jgi:hypothetical protein
LVTLRLWLLWTGVVTSSVSVSPDVSVMATAL